MANGGYYGYACAYRFEFNCFNFVVCKGSTCLDCLCNGRPEKPMISDGSSLGRVIDEWTEIKSNPSQSFDKETKIVSSEDNGSGSKDDPKDSGSGAVSDSKASDSSPKK